MPKQETLQKEKTFFTQLQSVRPYQAARQELNFATDAQLRLLVYTVHRIVCGEIPISQENYAAIERTNKLNVLQSGFECKDKLTNLFSQNNWRELILKSLYPVTSTFPNLLQEVVNRFDIVKKVKHETVRSDSSSDECSSEDSQ